MGTTLKQIFKMENGDQFNALNVFSPDGRLIQLEHAHKSSDQGTLITFACCKESIAIAFDLKSINPLKIPNELVYLIDENIYLSFSGLRPDSLKIIDRARFLCRNYKYNNLVDIPIQNLAKLLSEYM